MKMLSLSSISAGILVFAFPTGSDSCAIPPPAPVFATAQRPADPDEFVKGKIGVIRPSFQRRYLIGAYRILSGKPLGPNEAAAILGPVKAAPAAYTDSAAAKWGAAKNKVAANSTAFLNTFKAKSTNGSFVYYRNCLDDAFDAAITTFTKRAAQWGESDPKLREWVAAQDQVFANCSGKDAVIPEAPSAGMDPLLASDRRYQIAAAYFYAADWQRARDAFEEVAQDRASPWRGIAPYLVARTYIREGSVDNNREALRQAEQRLQAIMDDPAQREWHEASRKLLDYVRLRIDPGPRLAELAAELSGARPSPDLGQSAADFLYLYGRMTEQLGDGLTDLTASSDLADWLLTLEGGHTADAGPHALAQWNRTRSPAWLLAALAHGGDPEAIRAARGTRPDAPEYEAVTYYGILADPDKPDARAWADEALTEKLLLSSRNLILSERLTLAQDWNEFLRFAPRAPEPKLQSFDGSEEETDQPPISTGAAPLFDADAAAALNLKIPFSLWNDAAANRLLPAHLELQVAEAAWVRALVLGKDAEARALMQRIVQLQPAFAAPARDFLRASDGAAARFAGVFLLLRTPSLTAFVEPGATAADLTGTSDLGSITWGFTTGCLPDGALERRDPPAFLDAAQNAANTAEWKRMETVAPAGGGYLAAQTLAWADSHPDDPRIPQALHLVVQAGRRACRPQQEQVTYGRAAFELLHRRYPKSEWTAKTKYWYQ